VVGSGQQLCIAESTFALSKLAKYMACTEGTKFTCIGTISLIEILVVGGAPTCFRSFRTRATEAGMFAPAPWENGVSGSRRRAT